MNYSERVGQYALRGWIGRNCQFGGTLTPLHEVVAHDVTKLPHDLIKPLVRSFYVRRDAATDWTERYAAQDWIRAEVAALRKARLDVAFSEQEIEIESRKWAAICRSLGGYSAALPYVVALGVAVPEPKGRVTEKGIARRFACERWWRRQLRKLFTRSAETHLRSIGLVQRKKQLYASDRAVEWRRIRKLRDRALLKELEAVSDAGDQLELFGIVEKSVANPALRRAELMLRARGFDEIAIEHGHAADFWTLTTPSAFHRTHRLSGEPNERFEGFTPRDGQAWLCRIWAKVRAKLARLSILFYGFRIAEPHHDATPHWHVLLFMPAQHIETVRAIIKGFWLSEYAHEYGAREHRAEVITVDRAKGSAAGYIAKYVAKNIDGFEVGEDHESDEKKPAQETVDRVAAWASAHGIRQFQQLGGPQVSIWRELRRLRNPVAIEQIEKARAAADEGQWSDFVTAIGGIHRGRNGHVKLDTEITGELNQYDELRGAQVVGVQCEYPEGGVSVLKDSATADDLQSKAARACPRPLFSRVRTRHKVWRIQRKAETSDCISGKVNANARACAPVSSSSLGPVSITVRPEIIGPLTMNSIGARVVTRHRSRGDPHGTKFDS